MFSIRFKQKDGEFTATIKWHRPGDGTQERVYRLYPISSTLDFDKTFNFDPENTRNPGVNGEQVQASVFRTVGQQFGAHWEGREENERLGLLVFFADIFVGGTSVVSSTALPLNMWASDSGDNDDSSHH